MDLFNLTTEQLKELPGLWAFAGAFAISLFGSAHCAGMCGGLVMATTKTSKDRWFYHLGRLTAYLTLGALMGWLGANLLWNAIGSTWGKLTAVTLIGLVLLTILFKQSLGAFVDKLLSKLPSSTLSKPFLKFQTSVQSIPQELQSGVSGFGSILLPCGWLYTFVFTALSIGNPVYGAVLLFSFWLGTLPALIWGPALLNLLTSRIGVSTKAVTLFFWIVGAATLVVRIGSDPKCH